LPHSTSTLAAAGKSSTKCRATAWPAASISSPLEMPAATARASASCICAAVNSFMPEPPLGVRGQAQGEPASRHAALVRPGASLGDSLVDALQRLVVEFDSGGRYVLLDLGDAGRAGYDTADTGL